MAAHCEHEGDGHSALGYSGVQYYSGGGMTYSLNCLGCVRKFRDYIGC